MEMQEVGQFMVLHFYGVILPTCKRLNASYCPFLWGQIENSNTNKLGWGQKSSMGTLDNILQEAQVKIQLFKWGIWICISTIPNCAESLNFETAGLSKSLEIFE